ncbi:MAG: succinylglutamate desuccinylase/aspartoacylase family protein [Phycisphaerales bacterium]|nr:succinylglutamate desuccinylase/aspartoacylase family protein [Phycisphaerales bacterium]
MPLTESPSQPNTRSVQSDPPRLQIKQRELGRFRDTQSGPTLVVIGGVHGNEPAGLIAGQRVLDHLQSVDAHAFQGQFVLLAGNMSALNDHDPDSRYIDHDLNRLCLDAHFAEPSTTSAEHQEMHELFSVLESIQHAASNADQEMIVLDLHTTSSNSRPVVVFEDSLAARSHAMRMPCPKYLGIEEEIDGLVIDAVTNRLGCVSYLVEGGQHEDPRSIDVHEAAIWIALDSAGIYPIAQSPGDPGAVIRKAAMDREGVVYDVRHREPILDESFTICNDIFNGTHAIAEKTVLAIQSGQPVHSPITGLIFLPNMQTHKRIGDDGFFIVRRISPGWVNLSARLRRKHWVHRMILLMPGVYQGESSTLLVDADLACVLRRQVFHLLGYRLVRHDGREGGTGVVRFFKGIGAFCKAIVRGPIRGQYGDGPDPSDPRFWIVARRRLDQPI